MRLAFCFGLLVSACSEPAMVPQDGSVDATPDARVDSGPRPPLEPRFIADGVDRVWIDTDLAIGENAARDPDDGWALLYAIHAFPERIVGVSLGYGNTEDLDYQERTARRFLHEFTTLGLGQNPVPIALGAQGPEDLGRATEATRLLIDALEASSLQNPLAILALGRLTTVATVLQQRPDLQPRIRAVYINGGRRGPEPSRPELDHYVPELSDLRLPDTNFDDDYASVRVLLESNVAIVVVPVELNEKHPITRVMLDRFAAGGAAVSFCAQASRDWLQLFENLGGSGFWPFDVGVMLAYHRPQLLISETVGARIVRMQNDTFRGPREDKDYFVVSSTFSERSVQYVYDTPDRRALSEAMSESLLGAE